MEKKNSGPSIRNMCSLKYQEPQCNFTSDDEQFNAVPRLDFDLSGDNEAARRYIRVILLMIFKSAACQTVSLRWDGTCLELVYCSPIALHFILGGWYLWGVHVYNGLSPHCVRLGKPVSAMFLLSHMLLTQTASWTVISRL